MLTVISPMTNQIQSSQVALCLAEAKKIYLKKGILINGSRVDKGAK